MAQLAHSCASCIQEGILCELGLVKSDETLPSCCTECENAGENCAIPVSDEAMLDMGVRTASFGERKCLRCALLHLDCTFLKGRPLPCIACVSSRKPFCTIPANIPNFQQVTGIEYLAVSNKLACGTGLDQFQYLQPDLQNPSEAYWPSYPQISDQSQQDEYTGLVYQADASDYLTDNANQIDVLDDGSQFIVLAQPEYSDDLTMNEISMEGCIYPQGATPITQPPNSPFFDSPPPASPSPLLAPPPSPVLKDCLFGEYIDPDQFH
ncbi:hypothetical protein F5B20DRAFT_522865 [Whalleya microplaca]|nr:hypothetical protein F5B20DRAFT_522865 [Whalleya microplaca]